MKEEPEIPISPDIKSEECPISCPRCGKPSTAIKVVHFPIILVLILFFLFWKKTVVACPSCIRKQTLLFLFINLFTMHIAWPVCLVLSLIPVIRSFIPGHSQEVLDTLDSQPNWEPTPENPSVRKAPAPKSLDDGTFRSSE